MIKAQEEGMMNFVPTRSSYLVPLSNRFKPVLIGNYSRAVLRVLNNKSRNGCSYILSAYENYVGFLQCVSEFKHTYAIKNNEIV